MPLLWVEDGALRSTVPVAALGRPASGRGGPGAAPTAWRRPDPDDLRVQRKLVAAAGQEIVFLLTKNERGESGPWGLVRLLTADRDAAEVEWMVAAWEDEELVREPGRVLVEGLPDGHRISWEESDSAPDGTWRVAARPLGAKGPVEAVALTTHRSLLVPAEPGAAIEYLIERSGEFRSARRPGRRPAPGGSPGRPRPSRRASGSTSSRARSTGEAHLEITQVHPTSAFVIPLEGVSLQRGGKPGAPMTWTPYLPDPRVRTLAGRRPAWRPARTSSSGPRRPLRPAVAERSEDGTIVVRRQVDLARTGVFPVPPAFRSWRDGRGGGLGPSRSLRSPSAFLI